MIKPRLLFFLFFIFTSCIVIANTNNLQVKDSTPHSTKQQAIDFLNNIKELPQSNIWMNIDPDLFLENIKLNIQQPLHFYEGRSTNFCSYAALTFLLINENPLGYAQCMLELYKTGKAHYRHIHFSPSAAIKKAAGTLKYKGALDIRPADQMWFLCLANHFKGYVNIFNLHFNRGDEDKLWASTNFSKFNRMAKRLLNFKIEAVGSDLIRPKIKNLTAYLNEKLSDSTGYVVLYLNNKFLHRHNHVFINLQIPTHYVILKNISVDENDIATFTYWDYGSFTRQQFNYAMLKNIIFGISYCTKK